MEGLSASLRASKPPALTRPPHAQRSSRSPIQGCHCLPPTHRSPHHLLLLSEKVTPALPGNRSERTAAGMADRCVTAATTLSPCHAKASSSCNRSGWGCDRAQMQGCTPVSCTRLGMMRNTELMCCRPFSSQTPQLACFQFSFCYSLLAEGDGDKRLSLCAFINRET